VLKSAGFTRPEVPTFCGIVPFREIPLACLHRILFKSVQLCSPTHLSRSSVCPPLSSVEVILAWSVISMDGMKQEVLGFLLRDTWKQYGFWQDSKQSSGWVWYLHKYPTDPPVKKNTNHKTFAKHSRMSLYVPFNVPVVFILYSQCLQSLHQLDYFPSMMKGM
jgi:hypothetical protein